MEHLAREVLVEDLSQAGVDLLKYMMATSKKKKKKKAGVDQGDDAPLHALLVRVQLLQQVNSRLANCT